MRRYRPLPAVRLRDPRLRPGRRLLRTQRARDRRQGSRTLQDVHRRAATRSRRTTSTRSIPTTSSTAPIRGMLGTLDPHSSFFEPEGIRADARAAGRALLRHRHHDRQAIDGDITAMQRLRRHRRRTRRASAAATSSPTIDGEDAKGWTIDQAMRKLRGPKGTHGQHRASSAAATNELIPLDADARRGLHPDRARRTS